MVVVGDIDRGGMFAAMYGTVALLAPEDQALIAGFVVNKFRGDPALLAPGLEDADRAHRSADATACCPGTPTSGWTPRTPSTSTAAVPGADRSAAGRGRAPPTDQQLHRRRRARPSSPMSTSGSRSAPRDLAGADLVVLPGTRATLRRPGVAARARPRGRDCRAHACAAGPCSASAEGPRCSAGPIEDPDRDRGSTGDEHRSWPGRGTHAFRRGEGPRRAARKLAGAPGRGVRDPPRAVRPRRRRVLPGWGAPRSGVRHHVARQHGERRLSSGLPR